MSGRSRSALKLERSPLVHVLSQIRFSPVLKVDKYIGDIQESFRDTGLPRMNEEEVQQFVVGPGIEADRSSRWVFSDRGKHEAVVLTKDFLVYEVSRYTTFEAFVNRASSLFRIAFDQMRVEFGTQIGLRYVNLIRPSRGLQLAEMFGPGLRGLTAEELGVKEAKHQFVIQCGTEHGTLRVRSTEGTGGRFLPPDLQSEHLDHEIEPEGLDSFRLLDLDHISKEDFDLDDESLRDRLWSLHENVEQAFRKSVTNEALSHWGDASE